MYKRAVFSYLDSDLNVYRRSGRHDNIMFSYYIPQAQQTPYFIRAQRSAKYFYLLVFNYRKLCRT